MQTEKLNVTFGNGITKGEVVIREVNTVNELPVKPPLKIDIQGSIGAPFEFLKKRKDIIEQIKEESCHVLVNREKISIVLIFNERDEYNKGIISGKLDLHPKFIDFGINTGKVWTPTELGLFFKMNRAFFTTAEDNMKLVTDLMNFKGTVDSKIERNLKENGDRTDNFSQIVNSNLPKAFKLKIPIFKGMASEIIDVETFAQINGREVAFTLLSPGAQATQDTIRDGIIDEQLLKIAETSPKIPIIEV